MFRFFRRKDTAVRVFLGALLVLVCISLLLYLIPGLTDTGSSEVLVLARVGGEKVTSPEVMRQIQLLTRNNRVPSSMLPLYAPQILNQMVTEKVVLMEARRMGLSVSAEELAVQLALNPQIFPGGKFIGDNEYRGFIETRFSMTVQQFEDKFREVLLSDKLRHLVTAGVTVRDDEVVREYHRRNDKFRFEYVLLKTEEVKNSLQISEAEIADFFQKNRSGYRVPERRQFKFIFADTARLKETVTVDERELQRFYSENKDRYRVPDRVKVSHILFKTVGKNSEETEAVRKKAQGILQKLRAGEEFAALAKANSDDATTTPKGGDLGWVVRGQTVPEFEKTAFSLQPGATSDIIQTTYGFHILRVHEREMAHQQTLAEVREQILPQAKQEKAQRAAEELTRRAENALKKNPGNFQAVASQVGLQIIETGLLKRDDPLPQAGSSTAAEDALFAASLKPNAMTPAVTVPNGLVIALLVQISPAHPAELAEFRDQVAKDLRTEKAGQLAISRMKDFAEQARKAGDLQKVAAAQKLTVKTSEFVTRDGSLPEVGPATSLGEHAFSMKVGEIGDPVSVTDGQLVFRILERKETTAEEVAQGKEAVGRDLLESRRSTFFQLFVENLRTRLEREGKLKVNQAAMERLTASLQ